MTRNHRILPQVETLEDRWAPAGVTLKLTLSMNLAPMAAPQAALPPGPCLPAATVEAGGGAWKPGSWDLHLPAVKNLGTLKGPGFVGDPEIYKVEDPNEIHGVTFGGRRAAFTPGPDDYGNPEDKQGVSDPDEKHGLVGTDGGKPADLVGAFFAKFGK